SARGIVQFRSRKNRVAVATACDEHLTVRKQCGRVTTPRVSEAARRTPGSARRIVQFRACKNAIAVATTRDEHLAVWKQCGRVATRLTSSRGGEAARRTPSSACRIVQFRARKNERRAVALSCHDEHLSVKKQRCRVIS